MDWLQIVCLLGGIVIFIISFIIPEKKEHIQEDKRQREQIQKIVDEQLKEAKSKLNESVEETVSQAVEKAERSLERVSNEKIMAVNEYSDTVLDDINKNHEEAVFLYSMLNDKHDNIKSTVATVEQSTKEAKKAVHEVNQAKEAVMSVKDVFDAIERAEAESRTVNKTMIETEQGTTQINTVMLDGKETSVDEIYAELFANEKTTTEEKIIAQIANKDMSTDKNKEPLQTSQKANAKSVTKVSDVKAPVSKASNKSVEKKANVSMPSFGGNKGGGNHNERILALHKEGKSNVAIAKELGLGVGEVKLVIDLYKQS